MLLSCLHTGANSDDNSMEGRACVLISSFLIKSADIALVARSSRGYQQSYYV
jgi:hypothetical protein